MDNTRQNGITVSDARRMHIADLARGTDPSARRQLALRERGAALVRGILRTVGVSSYGADWRGYDGPSGWHVTAYVTPELSVGFVNIAQGVAVATDVQLDLEVAEALTVPEQDEGVLASGAAAWTAPDVGLAQLAQGSDGVMRLGPPKLGPEAPRGWTQLALDLRGTADAVPCSARVVAWGLHTCYEGRRGEPGAQHFDAPGRRLRADEWPLSGAQRARLRAVGEPMLRRIALQLADIAGMRSDIESTLGAGPADESHIAAAMRLLALPRSDAYTPAGSLRGAISSITDISRDALRRAGIARISAMGDVSATIGGRYWDLLQALLDWILRRDLAPVAAALWSAAQPHVERTGIGHSHPPGRYLDQRVVEPLLTEIAPTMADLVLGDVTRGAQDYATLCEALYADGYLEVDLPLGPRADGAASQ